MGVEVLAELQDMLYAQDRWAVLLIFQAMDAAGKDGAIKHVMSGINPQGCQVYSFKAPSSEDLDHDYLWRCMNASPSAAASASSTAATTRRRSSCACTRSFSPSRKLPPELVTKDIWQDRFQDIRTFERYLTRNGVAVRKFFLHVSKERAEEALPRAPREPGEELEVLGQRRQGARPLGGLHGGLRGHDPPHRHRRCALVRRAGRQQVVHARRGRRGGHRCAASLDLHYPKVGKEQLKELAAAKQALLGGKS